MSRIYASADKLIGHTPLLRLSNIEKKLKFKKNMPIYNLPDFKGCVL